MKTNKKVWKIVSAILALAMVVSLLPSGFLGVTQEVDATIQPAQEDITNVSTKSLSKEWLSEDFEDFATLNPNFVGSDTVNTTIANNALYFKNQSASTLTAGQWLFRYSGSTANHAINLSAQISDEWDSEGNENGHSMLFQGTNSTMASHVSLLTSVSENDLSQEIIDFMDASVEESTDDKTVEKTTTITVSYDFRSEKSSNSSSITYNISSQAIVSSGYNIDSSGTSWYATSATYNNTIPYSTSYHTKIPSVNVLGTKASTFYLGSTDSTYQQALEDCAAAVEQGIEYTYEGINGSTLSYIAEEDTDGDGVADILIAEGNKTVSAELIRTSEGKYYIAIDMQYLTTDSGKFYVDNIKVSLDVEETTTEYLQHARSVYSDQEEWYNIITPYSDDLLNEKYEDGTISTTLYSTTVDSQLFADGTATGAGGLTESATRAYDAEDYDVGSFENTGDWTVWHTGTGTDQSLKINYWYGGGSGWYKAHWGNNIGNAYFTTVASLAAGDYQANVKSYAYSTGTTQIYVVADLDVAANGLGDGQYELTDEGYSILGQITIGSTGTAQTASKLVYGTVTDNETGNVLFSISEDYEECAIGLLVVGTASSYGELDDFFLIGPDNSSLVKEDDNSYLEQEDWYNLVTPYSDSALSSALAAGTISTDIYSKDVDAALTDSSYNNGNSENYSVGSFENATYWKTSGTHTGTLNKNYDLSTNTWYTGYSGTSVGNWGWGAANSTIFFYTTVDAMAAGYYQSNVKGIGENAIIYLVADLPVDDETGLGDGQYELTDEGYSILATLNSKANASGFKNGETTDTSESIGYFTVKGNSSGNAVFKLSEDYTNVNIGIYIIETTDSSWGYIDDFFLIGPDNSNVFVPIVYDIDDLSNGDFEAGLDTNWTVEEYDGSDIQVEITEDVYNSLSAGGYNVWEQDGSYYIWLAGGYTIDYTGRSGSTTTTVEADNSAYKYELLNMTPNNYVLQMSRIVQMSEAGSYKIKVDTMGRWSEDEFKIVVTTYDYDEENQYKEENTDDVLLSYSVPTTGSFAGFNENISDDTFEVEAGQFVVVRIYVNLDGYSNYGDGDDSLVFDNIHIVSEDYDGDGYDVLHGTDQFGDAFTSYALSNYWQYDIDMDGVTVDDMTADDNNCLYYGAWDYGYSMGWDDTRENDYYYFNAYVNTSDTYKFTLTQYIDFTKNGKYTLQADLQGVLSYNSANGEYNKDGGFAVTAYTADAEGNIDYDNVVWSGTVSGDDINNDGFTTLTIGSPISVTKGTTLAFVISGTLVGTGSDDISSSLNIDNVKLVTYVPRDAVEDDYTYEGVAYTTNDGVSKLVNGGTLIKGVDISSIISIEESGITFVDENEDEADIFDILANAGVNYIRVRVWNDPTDSAGNTYGGGHNDLATAVTIAERAARAGLSLYVDFMCSDFWADPERQLSPKAWADYSVSAKATALAKYIDDSLTKIQATGVSIGIVSIGNEITTWDSDTSSYVFMGESGSDYATLLSAGADAVRAFDSNILVALHVAGSGGGYVSYYARFFEDIDYDIFAASYYPYSTTYTLDGSMDTFISELNSVAANYGKMTMIAEYNWPFTQTDVDGYQDGVITNTANAGYAYNYCTLNSASSVNYNAAIAYYKAQGYVDSNGNVSEEGQYYAITDIIKNSATAITNCIGSFYWEAAWVDVTNTPYTVDGVTYSSRAAKWKAFGSGVATAAASSYVGWGSDSAGSAADTYALFQSDESTILNGKVVAKLNSFTASDNSTEYTVNAFGANGEDGNMPINIARAQVQQISDSATSYAFRLVGELNRQVEDETADNYDPVEDVGFRVFLYDSNGNILSSDAQTYSYLDKTTTTLYTSVIADGVSMSPTDGYRYFYAYTYRGIPTGNVYYFEVRANSNDIEYCAYYQRASKIYAVYNGHLALLDSADQIGTLTGDDVISLESAAATSAE